MLGLCCFVDFLLVSESGGYSLVGHVGFSLQWLLSLQNTGLVALRHVGSSWIRDRTCVSCVGRGFFTAESAGRPLSYFLKVIPVVARGIVRVSRTLFLEP